MVCRSPFTSTYLSDICHSITRILLLTSTVLMILSSISIGASLSQELTAFIDGPKANIPATLTFLNNALPAQIVKASVYVTIVSYL